jgi:hypothetical protein
MKTLLKKVTKKESHIEGKIKKSIITYFIDTSSESIDSEEKVKISLDRALDKINRLEEGDHIGFVNTNKCIQFMKDDNNKWSVDCPVLNIKKEYIYSLGQEGLTTKTVCKITSLFFLDEKWEHICTNLKRIN